MFLGNGNIFLAAHQKGLPPMSVITDLVPSNVTMPELQTLADGKADLTPQLYGMTWRRFQLVDYSAYLVSGETFIISRSSVTSTGSIFKEVFDTASYLTFLALVVIQVWF